MITVKMSDEDRRFNRLAIITCTIACIIILYPMYFIVIASFSEPEMVMAGEVIFVPKGINFSGYKESLHTIPMERLS